MEIRSEYVELKVSDGTTMQAWTARPTNGGSLPGLLVFQEAYGVNAHIREVTQRFAREGFIAIAPELFHRTGPGFEGSYDAFATTTPHLSALKDDQMEADERAAFNWLTAQGVTEGRIGAVGYCMGGRAAFLAGLTLPIGCATSYYGGGIAPRGASPGLLMRARDLRCPVLLFWGGKDKHLTQDQVRAVRDALSDAGKDFINVEISDADHGFFCDQRASYNPVAAAEAWPLTLAFLRLHTAQAAVAAR
jgi:carboxymethylenebutenolidase